MEENFNVEDFGENKLSKIENIEVCHSSPKEISLERECKIGTERGYVQWAEVFNDSFTATGEVKKQLPPGLYKIEQDNRGNFYFNRHPIKTDELIRFTDSVADGILKEIEHFWKLKHVFILNKFLHRRGYLFYGPQGSGKSIIVQQIISGIIAMNGVAIWIDSYPDDFLKAIQVLRKVEPERPIVVVFEDIDAIIKKYGDSGLLAYLDGEGQTDMVLNLATTNYPELLDKRIVARPRRFDRVIKIDMPGGTVRKEYFKCKVKDLSEEQLEKWVTSTAGFSFAALADLIISVKCFEYSFEDAVEKLRKLVNASPSSEDFRVNKVGFSD